MFKEFLALSKLDEQNPTTHKRMGEIYEWCSVLKGPLLSESKGHAESSFERESFLERGKLAGGQEDAELPLVKFMNGRCVILAPEKFEISIPATGARGWCDGDARNSDPPSLLFFWLARARPSNRAPDPSRGTHSARVVLEDPGPPQGGLRDEVRSSSARARRRPRALPGTSTGSPFPEKASFFSRDVSSSPPSASPSYVLPFSRQHPQVPGDDAGLRQDVAEQGLCRRPGQRPRRLDSRAAEGGSHSLLSSVDFRAFRVSLVIFF